ncbi:hypothetical protein Ctob_011641 [Chrysochromulina tobinii]|uniref:Uncharacterized protein n=1 Tax=Chrysochromulina tobinii TaxID=1460289 RepID=A0A0M0JH68_9EUKA|nr:hypothetical protein Ctob_011641 [Chrysochromulina tobinii]|eukprot:KOO25682.1 hypothetical protein Ctob_011641 [Chrysochromulina sp. CCMP291]
MGPQSFKLDSVAMRWSLPADSHSNYALGGGITFAIHRDFCARLIPLFPEQGYEAKLFGDFFLDCEDIRSAIARAMDTWAENHKNINFKDVSERCAHVLTTDYCPHAEIFIVPEHLEGTSTTSDLAAWVTHNLSETSITRSPTTTSGFEIPFNPSNAAATPEAANHEVVLEQQPARGQRPGARPALNACGEPPQLSHKGEISRDQNDLACGSPRCTHLLDYLAVMPTGLLTFSLFWLIFCPAFYFRVFLPCWDCFDFEASIAHETRSIQSSIMFSLTTHKSRTCLSADDLEGLNYLYPVCSGAFDVSPEQPEPLCIKPKSLSGWLRLLYITFTPFVIITLLILSVQLCVRRHQKRKLRNLVETGERLRQQRTELIRKFKEAALKRAVSNAQNFRGNMLARAGTSRTLSGISARCSFGPQSPGRESQGASGRSLGGVNSHLGGGASSPAQHNREVEMERRRQQLAEVEEANLQAALAISRGEPPPMPTAGSLGFVGSRAFATSTEGLSIEEDGEAPAEIEEANLQAALAASRVISVPARQVLGTRQQARFSEAGNSPEAHV